MKIMQSKAFRGKNVHCYIKITQINLKDKGAVYGRGRKHDDYSFAFFNIRGPETFLSRFRI
jgi:hypothetical protein